MQHNNPGETIHTSKVETVTITESWTCPTCNSTVSTIYCSACGERPLHAGDLTLRGLLDQLFQALSNIDGRLIRSFRCLLTCPGTLTVAYVRGQRMPYIGPFQLFIIANVLFFATQSLTNTNIFSSTLDSHLHGQDWSAVAQQLVSRRLETVQMTLDSYAPIFNRAVVLNAKSLIILMVLPFAILLPIMFHRNRQPFVVHVVFGVHFYAFLLLLFCTSLAVAAVDVWFGDSGLNSARMDKILTVINLGACATYLYKATGTVYGASGASRVIKVLALALAAAGIGLGYRFLLFLITLYST